ncbi:MAG: HlyC/CorC family transporter [Clostridia bacterium]|nr:HlyC/CorC family transporter [Clostridia bacterium]
MSDTFTLILLQVVLIALNAVFACAEIAVLSVNETKLNKMAEDGNKKAKRLSKLTKEPAKFLATIQVAITLSGFLGSAFAAENFSDGIVEWLISLGVTVDRSILDSISVVIITLILSYFTLVFGELVPKRIAMKKSEKLALGISGLVSGISVIFKPIVWFLSASTNLILRLFGIDPNEEEEEVSEEEIRMMVDAGSESGTIDDEEKEIIHNVFEFDDLTAGEIATHRTDVTFLWLEDSDEDWAKTIRENHHTRYPICEDSPDHIVGILNSKEYYRLEDKSRKNVMENAVRDAYFVPETIKADTLFKNMRKDKTPLAVVLDEYGGLVGILTVNDLISQIVGEITDESEGDDKNEPEIVKIGDNLFEVNGNITLSKLESECDVDFDDEKYGTLTGLVFDALDYIPQDGEQDIDVTIDNMKVHITLIKNHQIEKATLTVLEKSDENEDDEDDEDDKKKRKHKKDDDED